jgi:hypothetical protein
MYVYMYVCIYVSMYLCWDIEVCVLARNADTRRTRVHVCYKLAIDQRDSDLYTCMYHEIMTTGAKGAYLSGAGPSVMCITSGGSGDHFTQSRSQRQDERVAAALIAEAEKMGVKGKVYITHPSNIGGVVVHADPPFSNELVTYNGNT